MSIRHIFIVCAVLCTVPVAAQATLISTETRETTIAVICKDGNPFCTNADRSQVDDIQVNGNSSSSNFDGDLNTPSEARAAARSGTSDIAANAVIHHRNLTQAGQQFEKYSDVRAQTLFETDVQALTAGDVTLHFVLPAGFVEIQSNAELRDLLEITATIQAVISICRPACSDTGFGDHLFQLDAELQGGFDTFSEFNNASSANPTLDLSPLLDDTVTDDNQGFIRTLTWDYDTFEGDINLGHFVGGQTFSIGYVMHAEVFMRNKDTQLAAANFQTNALAAINDPFVLNGDPLISFAFEEDGQQPPAVATPEPATLTLFGIGAAGIRVLRRRRRRMIQA